MDRSKIPAGHSARLIAWEPRIHAFVHLAEPAAGPEAGRAVSGLTVGVKDVIDAAGMPTRNGSATHAEAPPAARDAPVVARLRAAGARILGKTTTTEFAFTDPTACRNPHDLARSPGGSSSGSGAAVAAGIVDIALGTQTAGSLCRPAAYCGVVGLKPTFGIVPTEGVTPLAPSFDTIGIIARSVRLAAEAFRVVAPAAAEAVANPASRCTSGALILDPATPAAPDVLAAFDQATAALADICAGQAPPSTAVDIAAVVADHRTVMHFEAARAHGHFLTGAAAALLQPKFRAALEAGLSLSPADAHAARDRLAEARAAFWSDLATIDIVLTLPVPDGAPRLDGTTGFQDWLTPWTVFGGPLVCLPWGADRLGRPRAVMLAAHPNQDATLVGVAAALAARAPVLDPPVLPQD